MDLSLWSLASDSDAEPRWRAVNDHSTTAASAAAAAAATAPTTDENSVPAAVAGPVRATFTPTQVKYQPRAWQRKLATPASASASTSSSQHQSRKIWKRVPLQTITSNVNAAWERGGNGGGSGGGGDSDGIMRPVKKIRIATTTAAALNASDSNKENAFVGIIAKWDPEPSPLKTPRRRRPQQDWIHDADATTNDCSDLAYNFDGSRASVTSPLPSSSPSPALPLLAVELDTARTEADSGDSDAHVEPLDREDTPPVPLVLESQPATALADQALFDLSPPEEGQSVTVTVNQSHLDDQDDTAYLQAFLSRTRAQRDANANANANAQLAQTSSSVPLNTVHLSSASDAPSNPGSADHAASEQPPDSKNRVSDKAKVQPSSPCRRSSRLTRVARPQKLTALPNTISLRRLNGTEFVAMQKEARSIATATRANTKRNKGGAINVRERLVQLHAEMHESVDEQRQKTGKAVVWAVVLARMQGAGGDEVPYTPDQKPEPEGTSEQDHQAEVVDRRREEESVAKRKINTIGLLLSNGDAEHDEPEDQQHVEVEVPKPTPMKKKRSRTDKIP